MSLQKTDPLPLAVPSSGFGGQRRLVLVNRCARKSSLHPTLTAAFYCANETDLNYINPLEIPPMGDCNLAECKKLARGKLALMGNLHTTEVMLRGSTDLVRLTALRAILDAGMDGGFVLSTGDQCGRDTPDDNIRELVRVAEEFGYYPLNEDQIRTEILRLERKLKNT